MNEKFYLGDNELIIVQKNDIFCVKEFFEQYDIVFSGSYDDCLDYCVNRLIHFFDNFYNFIY